MGLDMYLYRTKRVEALTIDDYTEVSNALNELNSMKDFNGIENLEIEGFKPEMAELNDVVAEKGTSFTWVDIF